MDKLWAEQPFALDSSSDFLSTWEWFEKMQLKWNEDTLQLVIIITWKAWESRNNEMHGEPSLKPLYFTNWSRSYLESYKKAQFPPGINMTQRHPSRWKAPPVGLIKINVDVGFPNGMDFYSTAMVARDWNGKCLWWSVLQRPGRPKVIEGEAHAILYALTTGRSRGWEEIIVEGDCLPIIEALTKDDLLESTYGAFVEESLALSKSFRNCSFSFVKRNGNRLAHLLAAKVDLSCTEAENLPSEYGE